MDRYKVLNGWASLTKDYPVERIQESKYNRNKKARYFRIRLCTQRRNRTGTVSYRCLRPTRLPVPPAGHFLSTMRDILKESLRDKHNKILIIYRIQTLNLFKLSRIRIRYFCRYHISLTFRRILFESAPSN